VPRCRTAGTARRRRAAGGACRRPAGHGLAAEARRALVFTGAGLALAAGLLAGPGGLGVDLLLRALALYGFGAWLVWRGLGAGGGGGGAAVHRDPARRRSRASARPRIRMRVSAPPTGSRWAAWRRWRRSARVSASRCWPPAAAGGGLGGGRGRHAGGAAGCVDGALARRSGLASAFGARFDMETDAAFTLVLAALVYHAGQAGAWALAAGLMRYAFVAAAAAWPWLAAPLAPSRRRQAVCVATITALIVALAPVVPAPLAGALAAAATALLALSFAVDVRALARARRPHSPEYRP
jgi:hypothetical protein